MKVAPTRPPRGLTELAIRAATAPDKPRKLTDGSGLYLEVHPKGGKYWRLKYRMAGREKRLSLGVYPEVGLKEARALRDAARVSIRKGVDPSVMRREEKQARASAARNASLVAQGLPLDNTFEAIAREWFEHQTHQWATSHSEKIIRRLERDLFPWIGRMPIETITPIDLLTLFRRIESRGAIETAHRAKQNCSQVFRYAVATQRASSDPSRDLRDALKPWRPQHYATILDRREIGRLLASLDGYQGNFITRCALKLAPLLFVRPGELRRAEWVEFDLTAAEWRIPASKMKARRIHIVPLSKQALEILRDLEQVTGRVKWLFPGIRSNGEPMSENTVNAALRRLGYPREAFTGHSFRSMASTTLHEAGWSSDIIERQLAHQERDAVKAAYNHAEHLPARRTMMQAWADQLEALQVAALSGPRTPSKN